MIEINNLTRKKIDGKFLAEIAKKVLKEEKNNSDISIVLVGSQKIKDLNKKYRKKNRATDVLSFTYMKSGEIVLCAQIIKQNAKRFGETFKKELTLVLIHGVLHILGYDHEVSGKDAKKMERKEEYYLSEEI